MRNLVLVALLTALGCVAPDPGDPPLAPSVNSYSCACHIVVGPLCRAAWCGRALTGTTVTPDGGCDLGVRTFRVCTPTDPPPVTLGDLRADCAGRVATFVGPLARRTFGEGCQGVYGEGPCQLTWSCTTADPQPTHEDRCDAPCVPADLSQDSTGLHPESATYVAADNQWQCGGPVAATPTVCARY